MIWRWSEQRDRRFTLYPPLCLQLASQEKCLSLQSLTSHMYSARWRRMKWRSYLYLVTCVAWVSSATSALSVSLASKYMYKIPYLSITKFKRLSVPCTNTEWLVDKSPVENSLFNVSCPSHSLLRSVFILQLILGPDNVITHILMLILIAHHL